MKELGFYLLAAAAGGLITSTVEYFLKYNLVDEILDLFRSLEGQVARLTAIANSAKQRADAAVAALKR